MLMIFIYNRYERTVSDHEDSEYSACLFYSTGGVTHNMMWSQPRQREYNMQSQESKRKSGAVRKLKTVDVVDPPG